MDVICFARLFEHFGQISLILFTMSLLQGYLPVIKRISQHFLAARYKVSSSFVRARPGV